MTTTTIAITSPPSTTNTPTTSEYRPTPFQHALVIDLSDFEDRPAMPARADGPHETSGTLHESSVSGEDFEPYGLDDMPDSDTASIQSDIEAKEYTPVSHSVYTRFLDHLNSIVRHDGQVHPPIDMVRFKATNFREFPSKLTWKALDGLRPRHLEIACGGLEEYDMQPLDELVTPWPLDSLLLSGASGCEEASRACESITSLTLDYCSGMRFPLPGGFKALRHITIIENNAATMFTQICREGVVQDTLETLKIKSVSGFDFTHLETPEDFKNALSGCTSLTSLDLTLNDHGDEYEAPEVGGSGSGVVVQVYAGLPPYLPKTLKHLRFRGPPKMVDELPQWLQHGTNTGWLPDLETFYFSLDVPGVFEPPQFTTVNKELMPEVAAATAAEVQRFLLGFSAQRPGVQILA